MCRSLLWGRRWDWQWSRRVGVLWGLIVLLDGPAYASAPTAKLVVGAMHAPPFAIHTDDGQWSGLSVELVQQVTQTLGVEVEWREYDYDLPGLVDAVEQGHLDAAIAVLPMTPPLRRASTFRMPISAPDFASIFVLAFFAAVLASAFTAVRLQPSFDGPADLAWARVIYSAGWKATVQRHMATDE